MAAEAALSFLKGTKGMLTWSAKDVSDVLKIPKRDAEQVMQLLEAQGYAQRTRQSGEWMTTSAGESVSGAKPPRFARQSVEQALDAVRERIKAVNKDASATLKVTQAVAFGDFLEVDRARVQAADVGITSEKRGERAGELRSASEAKQEYAFLRQLRGRTALLHLRPYAEWMSKRLHRKLL